MTPRQAEMLKRIAHTPRTAESFTGSDADSLLHEHAERYLLELQAEGYVYQDGAKWHATEDGRRYFAEQPAAAQSRLWGPWSTSSRYVPPKSEPARGAACMAAYRLPSRGVRT